MKNNSVLRVIMNLLDITGKELAAEIGTDATTVSKWKTNKRKIPYQSEYGMKIANYMLSDLFEVKQDLLMEFLEQLNPGIRGMKKEKQAECIRQLLSKKNDYFLLEKQQNLEEYQTNIQVFSPEYSGWELAMKLFHDKIRKTKKKAEIIACDFGNVNWEKAPEEVLEKQIEEIKQFSKEGHRMKIIDIIGESYRSPQILFRWFQIYMMHGVELYYVMDTLKELQRGCIYTTEEGGALVGVFALENPLDGAYIYYEDARMKRYYRKRTNYFLENATRILERINIDDNFYMVNLLADNLSPAEVTYMINPSPTYINMSPELLEEVLQKNDVSKEQIESCLKTVKKRHEIRKKCKYIQIYDIDKIEQRLSQETSEMELLSIVIGKKIYMTKEDFKKQLADIKQVVEAGDMEIYLVSFKECDVFRGDISFTVQENRLFIAWNDLLYDTMIYSKEPTFIGGMVMYTKEVLRKIHPLYKNMEWTIKQLEKYIEE